MASSKRVGAPVLLCDGPHCRCAARDKLRDALVAGGCTVERSRCLGICKGPVALVLLEGEWVVASRVRGKKARRSLVETVTSHGRRAIPKKRRIVGARRKRAIARGMRSRAAERR